MSALSGWARRRGVSLALVMGAMVASVPVAGPAGGVALSGSAGLDTSLPATDSQVAVSGRGRFASLKITVNQTRNLANQAISVTWTGGKRSDGTANFLQIMQCWGNDDGIVAGNPGPPPEQCEFGGKFKPGGAGKAAGDGLAESVRFETKSRVISHKGDPGFDPANGVLEPLEGRLWKPFRAVTGESVDVQIDPQFNAENPGTRKYWLNNFYDINTTNENDGALATANGTGAELFEAVTGQESSGLGCGQKVQPVPGGPPRAPKCWLVVVPRGTGPEENVGLPSPSDVDVSLGVATSPLGPRPWQNRIAVPLEFTPIENPCPPSAGQREIAGTELAASLAASWQPGLCGGGRPSYPYAELGGPAARRQLAKGGFGAPGMVVSSRPVEGAKGEPVTYAPVALSATVIGFNVERAPVSADPRPGVDKQAQKEEMALTGLRVAEMNLTPRLVAKLLTQSYGSQVRIQASDPGYEWVKKNPAAIGSDPEFLQFNPEFTLLRNGGKNFGGFVMRFGSTDEARSVWEYVLTDPEAKAWLDGAPDPSGMKVNPAFATTAQANSRGEAFANPVPDSFLKLDPYCYQGPPLGKNKILPPALCANDWLPFTDTAKTAARNIRRADDGAKIALNTNPDALVAVTDVWKRDGAQNYPGRTILGITGAPDAKRYGLQSARLSRAGDDGPSRRFIAPDQAGLVAAVDAMKPKGEPAVREPDPRAAVAGAYPLAELTYAAVKPLALDAKARDDFAAFVEYAAGPGQVPGFQPGQLPPGYAPLPVALRAQATAAAKTIRDLKPTAEPGDSPAPGPGTPSPSRSKSPSTAARPASGRSADSPSGGGTSPASGSASSASAQAPKDVALANTSNAAAKDNSPGGPRQLARTPAIVVSAVRFVAPVLVAVMLASALGVLEITKRPRDGGQRFGRPLSPDAPDRPGPPVGGGARR